MEENPRKIVKGDLFRCIKTIRWNKKLLYSKGKIYRSDEDGCITDEEGATLHIWVDYERTMEYFIPYISNKRKGYGRKERKTL